MWAVIYMAIIGTAAADRQRVQESERRTVAAACVRVAKIISLFDIFLLTLYPVMI